MATGFTLEDKQSCCGCGLVCDFLDGTTTIQYGIYVEFVCNTCLEKKEKN